MNLVLKTVGAGKKYKNFSKRGLSASTPAGPFYKQRARD
jgi:hypothetical protein